MLVLLSLFVLVIRFASAFDCQLYAIDQSSLDTKFIQINNDGSAETILHLGKTTFSATTGAANVNNRSFLATYHTYDAKAVPHFFLLNIDTKSKSISSNVSLVEIRDTGSFYQIAVVNDEEVIGIRDSFISPMALEVAKIYPSTGIMETIGIYPIGEFSIVMTYASRRRIYYNVVNSQLYGINIHTGKLEVNSTIRGVPVYGLDYDAKTDRLIAVIYSPVEEKHTWILTEVKIDKYHELQFIPIGNATVSFDQYLWSTTYTMNSAERLWISSWSVRDKYTATLLFFNLDSGKIVQTLETNLKDLNDLVCLN